MSNELTMNELDAVAGATTWAVPGGTVEKTPGGSTIMKFGNISIAVGRDGEICTGQSVPAPK